MKVYKVKDITRFAEYFIKEEHRDQLDKPSIKNTNFSHRQMINNVRFVSNREDDTLLNVPPCIGGGLIHKDSFLEEHFNRIFEETEDRFPKEAKYKDGVLKLSKEANEKVLHIKAKNLGVSPDSKTLDSYRDNIKTITFIPICAWYEDNDIVYALDYKGGVIYMSENLLRREE